MRTPIFDLAKLFPLLSKTICHLTLMNIKTRIELNHVEAAEIIKAHYASKQNGEIEVEILLPPNLVASPSALNLRNISAGARRDAGGYMNKIALIKEVRAMFGWGLLDAKNFVEAFYP